MKTPGSSEKAGPRVGAGVLPSPLAPARCKKPAEGEMPRRSEPRRFPSRPFPGRSRALLATPGRCTPGPCACQGNQASRLGHAPSPYWEASGPLSRVLMSPSPGLPAAERPSPPCACRTPGSQGTSRYSAGEELVSQAFPLPTGLKPCSERSGLPRSPGAWEEDPELGLCPEERTCASLAAGGDRAELSRIQNNPQPLLAVHRPPPRGASEKGNLSTQVLLSLFPCSFA